MTNHPHNRPFNQPRTAYNNNFQAQPVVTVPMEVPVDYVNQAERIAQASGNRVSSTKIRNMFGLFTDIFNELAVSSAQKLSAEQCMSLDTARVRLVYEAARGQDGPAIREFLENAKILNYLKSIENDADKFIRFYHYFEALVAYQKFYFPGK